MKKLFCSGCKKYLGEIKEAKLRKNISFLCKNCESKRVALELRNNKQIPKNKYGDFFNGIFG